MSDEWPVMARALTTRVHSPPRLMSDDDERDVMAIVRELERAPARWRLPLRWRKLLCRVFGHKPEKVPAILCGYHVHHPACVRCGWADLEPLAESKARPRWSV